MGTHTVAVSDATFEADVLKAKGPVVVDFWAEWCGPCKQIGPYLEEIAKEMEGKVTVAKLNVDHNQKTAAKYGIRGIPTLLVFKDGQVTATKVGSMPKTQLADWIKGSSGVA
jgi:thioredoxin 1